jgi:hypothetical protein
LIGTSRERYGRLALSISSSHRPVVDIARAAALELPDTDRTSVAQRDADTERLTAKQATK